METSVYASSDKTGVFIQLILIDAIQYPREDTDRYIHMAVSLIAVIERNAKKVAFINLPTSLPRYDQQTKKSLFTDIFYKRARGMRLLSIFIEATHLTHILTKRHRSFYRGL